MKTTPLTTQYFWFRCYQRAGTHITKALPKTYPALIQAASASWRTPSSLTTSRSSTTLSCSGTKTSPMNVRPTTTLFLAWVRNRRMVTPSSLISSNRKSSHKADSPAGLLDGCPARITLVASGRRPGRGGATPRPTDAFRGSMLRFFFSGFGDAYESDVITRQNLDFLSPKRPR